MKKAGTLVGCRPRMPTYIDESGDTGVKPGAMSFFRLAAVHFELVSDLEKYAAAIPALRQDLGLPQTFEFHFAEISHEIRLAFFEAIRDQDFWFFVSSFDKNRERQVPTTKQIVRDMTVQGIARHIGPWYELVEEVLYGGRALRELIVYDKSDDPAFERSLRTHFRPFSARGRRPGQLIRDVRPGKSNSDPGIQLADMICGAVGRHIDGREQYYDLIRHRQWVIEMV
jgi:hypothetical protein